MARSFDIASWVPAWPACGRCLNGKLVDSIETFVSGSGEWVEVTCRCHGETDTIRLMKHELAEGGLAGPELLPFKKGTR